MKFQNICFYETSKVAVSARAVGSDVRWRRILHEYLHVLRVTIHMRMQTFQPSIEPEVDWTIPTGWRVPVVTVEVLLVSITALLGNLEPRVSLKMDAVLLRASCAFAA